MKYPIDVNKRTSDQKKLIGQERTGVILGLFGIVSVALFFILQYALDLFFNLGTTATLIVQAILTLIFGSYIFRIFIFKEEEKKVELENYESDSFGKFMNLRKDAETTLDVQKQKIHVFEYTNGCAMCALELRFGSNNELKSEGTYNALYRIMGIALSAGYGIQWLVLPEDFMSSVECRNHIASINRSPLRKNAKHIMQSTMEVFQQCNEESNVDVLIAIFRSGTIYDQTDLEGMLTGILQTLKNEYTAFRSAKFLDIDGFLEVNRQYHCIPAIDLSMMQAIEIADAIDTEYRSLLSTYSFKGNNGKSYKLSGQAASGSQLLHEKEFK